MGILDDAIREHLELKRRRGADPAEIARLERDAFGPLRRPGEHAATQAEDPADLPQDAPSNGYEDESELFDSDNGEDRAPRFDDDVIDYASGDHEDEPHPGLADEQLTEEHPASHGWHEVDEPDGQPVGPSDVPGRWERASAGLSSAAGAAAPDFAGAHDAPTKPEEPVGGRQETHQAHEAGAIVAEEAQDTPLGGEEAPPARGASPAGPPESLDADASPTDETAGGDLLEETPEFLQDAPEHDRLWFEQAPPRDFDFGG